MTAHEHVPAILRRPSPNQQIDRLTSRRGSNALPAMHRQFGNAAVGRFAGARRGHAPAIDARPTVVVQRLVTSEEFAKTCTSGFEKDDPLPTIVTFLNDFHLARSRLPLVEWL